MSKVLPFLRLARSMRLTVMDMTILYEVRSIPGIRMTDLSARLGSTKGGIHACLYRLQDRGLLVVHQVKLGKAIKNINVTEAGAAVCAELELGVAA